MDTQQGKITGYRELSPAEVAVINEIKEHFAATEALIDKVNEVNSKLFASADSRCGEAHDVLIVDATAPVQLAFICPECGFACRPDTANAVGLERHGSCCRTECMIHCWTGGRGSWTTIRLSCIAEADRRRSGAEPK